MQHIRMLTKAQAVKAQVLSEEKQETLEWFNFTIDVLSVFTRLFGPKVF